MSSNTALVNKNAPKVKCPSLSNLAHAFALIACMNLHLTGTLYANSSIHSGFSLAPPRTIYSELASPRGIALAPSGHILIADAGYQGQPNSGGVLKVSPNGEAIPVIAEISNNVSTDSGFPVHHIHGVSDVAFWNGKPIVTLGSGTWIEAPLRGPNLLVRIDTATEVDTLFDLGLYEGLYDPDGNGPDSNANGVVVSQSGSIWVSDAGGNWVARISDDGDVDVVVPFPQDNREDAVPTGLAPGPAGSVYVSLFRCASPTPGKGGIALVQPNGTAEVVVAGLSNPIDVAVTADGNLLVLEFSEDYKPMSGNLLMVMEDGTTRMLASNLSYPTSVAAGQSGIYVTEMHSPTGGAFGTGRLLLFPWSR